MAMIPSLLLLSFLPFLVTVLKAQTDEQLVFRNHECDNFLGNFTDGSTYAKNRNTVLEKIYSDKEIDYGFYYFSYGEDPDKVNAIGLCRGDVKPDVCRTCLRTSAALLTERCGKQKQAIGYYDLCLLRYSQYPIYGVLQTKDPTVYYINESNKGGVSDSFNQTLSGLLERLKTNAADGDSRRKFAEDGVPVLPGSTSSNETIYALVQCTPDLSKQDCAQCLDSAFSRLSYWCNEKKQIKSCLCLGPSCSIRYDNSSFFDPIVNTTDAPPPKPSKAVPPALPPSASSAITTTTTPNTTAKGKSKTVIVIAIVVSVAVVGVLVVTICIYLRSRKPRHARHEYIGGEGQNEEEELDEADNDMNATELLQFDFATIRFATNNFSDTNKLGQGGFGTVYKGTLSDGHEVAIKRLSNNSEQGETEFKNEVLLTGKLQHRNLVKLLGFCLQRGERLLIYEFVPKRSLDYIIFDPIERAKLNWERRSKIIRGIGRGLLYLHEDSRLQIVHRDLKTSNILLDEELNPKISDFGIARLFDANQTQGKTENVVGTFGYMAPEYIKYGHFSIKSDVFSFGVIILEIVCGQRNTPIRDGENVENLLSMVWKNWRVGATSNIVDPKLNDGSKNEIMRCIHIGLLCVQEEIADRPTMNSVLLMLNSASFPLAEPSEPPFLMQPKRLSSIPSSGQYSETTRSSDSGSFPTQGSTNKSSITY